MTRLFQHVHQFAVSRLWHRRVFLPKIQKHSLRKLYRLPKLSKVKRIAIDEIYQGKKLGYLTIVMDL